MGEDDHCGCECHEEEGVHHVAPCCWPCKGCEKLTDDGAYCFDCEVIDFKQPPPKKFKVVALPAPPVETFRVDVDAVLRVWARDAFKEDE